MWRSLCSLCGEVMFWSFSTSLSLLSNIMLNLLTKSHFAFKLYCGLWISHVIMTHVVYMNTQKWLISKESDICSERKSWNGFYFQWNRHFRKVSVNKTFTHVQEQKKAKSPRHSTSIPSSVKSSYFKICRILWCWLLF